MSELSIQEVQTKTRAGVKSLTLRSLFLNFCQIISSLILARFLVPADYGLFGIITGWIGALIFLTDFGLGHAFMLKKEEITEAELESYLGIRLMLASVMSLLYLAAFPFIISYYKITNQYSWLLALYVVILFLDVVSSVPKTIFQKNLEFEKIAKIDFLATSFLYLVQIIMAIGGMGFWSFFCANLLKWAVSIWTGRRLLGRNFPRPKLNWKVFQNKIKLGVSFQLISIIPVVKSIFLPLVMAKSLSVSNIGLIFWLNNMVSLPRAIYYNYNHVFFTTLSKVSSRFNDVKVLATNSISFATVSISFTFGLGSYLGPVLINTFFGENFSQAAFYIHLACIAIALSTIEFIMHAILTATGKPTIVTKIQIISFVIDVILSYFLCLHYGLQGFFYAQIIVYFMTSAMIIFCCRLYLEKVFYWRLAYSLALALLIHLMPLPENRYWAIIGGTFIYTILFVGCAYCLDKKMVIDFFHKAKNRFN